MDISLDIYLQQPFFFPKYWGNFQESVLRSYKVQYFERLCSKYGSCSVLVLGKTHFEHPELLKLLCCWLLSFPSIPFPSISFHFVSFSFLSFHFLSFPVIFFSFLSCPFLVFIFLSAPFISCYFVSFHFLSFPFLIPTTKLLF